jgi:hypothetical protein
MEILVVVGLGLLLAGAPLALYFQTRRQNANLAKYGDHTTKIAAISAFTGEVIAKGTDVLSDNPDGREGWSENGGAGAGPNG